jgi:Ca2+-binding RTX toxin-like protein
MKRSLLGVVMAVALVLGTGAVALAATIDCTAGTTCTGTRNGDVMNGTPGPDDMHGRAGGDAMRGTGSSDEMEGGLGADTVYGGFGQGGVDLVFGNGANDTIIVAQRGFPEYDGEVEVTREVVDCGTGEDTVYRDRGLDVIANNCEHKRNGYPVMEMAAAHVGSSAQGGLIGTAASQQ